MVSCPNWTRNGRRHQWQSAPIGKFCVPDIDDGRDEALVLPTICDDFWGEESLKNNVARHSETLDRLAQSLRKLGMGDSQISEHIGGIFGEYRRELALKFERLSAKAKRGLRKVSPKQPASRSLFREQ